MPPTKSALSHLFSKLIILFFVCLYVPCCFAESVITKWVEVEVQALRGVKFLAPTISARELAIMHTCMYDAWTVYDATAKPTRSDGPPKQPGGTVADKEKAISFAAYKCGLDFYPDQKSRFDAQMRTLGYDPNDTTSGPAKVGIAAANSVLAFRHHDGSNQLGDLHPGAYSDYTNYQPVNTVDELRDPNHWQPQFAADGTVQKFLTPHWGKVIPFALTAHNQFLPPPPNFYPQSGYINQANEVLNQNATLNDRKKLIYEYWAEETQGFMAVPGHWNTLAKFVSIRDHLGLDDDVKLFFALNNAMLDASISCWDTKRFYDYVRPISAIRFLNKDKNIQAWGGPCQGTKTIRGEDWRPYSPPSLITPPFPEYISGHSTFGAAAAQILKLFTGSNRFNHSALIRAGISYIEGKDICPVNPVPSQDLLFNWPTYSTAAEENAISRLYGGIHFQQSASEGLRIGPLVANQVWDKAQNYFNGTI